MEAGFDNYFHSCFNVAGDPDQHHCPNPMQSKLRVMILLQELDTSEAFRHSESQISSLLLHRVSSNTSSISTYL